MDPNANLRQQLRVAAKVVELVDHPPEDMTSAEVQEELAHLANELAELVVALHEWRKKGGFDPYGNAGADWLLAIHKMLYPERYPRADQPDHIFWLQAPDEDEGEEVGVFEWSSETIEWVATMLERALKDDPRARLRP